MGSKYIIEQFHLFTFFFNMLLENFKITYVGVPAVRHKPT